MNTLSSMSLYPLVNFDSLLIEGDRFEQSGNGFFTHNLIFGSKMSVDLDTVPSPVNKNSLLHAINPLDVCEQYAFFQSTFLPQIPPSLLTYQSN